MSTIDLTAEMFFEHIAQCRACEDKRKLPPLIHHGIELKDAEKILTWMMQDFRDVPDYLARHLLTNQMFVKNMCLALKSAPQDKRQHLIFSFLDVLETQHRKDCAADYRKTRRKKQLFMAGIGAEHTILEILQYYAPQERLNFHGQGAGNLLERAIYKNNTEVVQFLTQYQNPKTNKSKMLYMAIWSKHMEMIDYLLPLSQPKKNNSYHLKTALGRMNDVSDKIQFKQGNHSKRYRFGVREDINQLESEKDFYQRVIQKLLPVSDVDACALNMSINDGLEWIVDHIKPKTIDRLIEKWQPIKKTEPLAMALLQQKQMENKLNAEGLINNKTIRHKKI